MGPLWVIGEQRGAAMKHSQQDRGPGKGREPGEGHEQKNRLEPKERADRIDRPERSDENERQERDGQARIDLGHLIESLHQQFEQDRALASQAGTARCGICYLYYRQTDLLYREEEGFYICQRCQRALGNGRIKMVRRQQR
jgi:hypothetical protein